jgi:hypothetical protein
MMPFPVYSCSEDCFVYRDSSIFYITYLITVERQTSSLDKDWRLMDFVILIPSASKHVFLMH